MFSLDDEMLDRLTASAANLPVGVRDSYLRSVAGRVQNTPNFGMPELERAIAFVLGSYGVAGGSRAFTQPKRRKSHAQIFR